MRGRGYIVLRISLGVTGFFKLNKLESNEHF